MLKYFSNGENPFTDKVNFSDFITRKAAYVIHVFLLL